MSRMAAAFAIGGLTVSILTSLGIGPIVVIVVTLCGALVLDRLEAER